MPKHNPTFKHLISTSYTDSTRKNHTQNEKSVNELLASSRTTHRVTDDHHQGASATGPSNVATARHLQPGETVWSPEGHVAPGLLGLEERAVHAAEVERRAAVQRRAVGRVVAGPAPPPSWGVVNTNGSGSMGGTAPVNGQGDGIVPGSRQTDGRSYPQHVTETELERASSLFSGYQPRNKDNTSRTLVEFCLRAVLRYLNDDTLLRYANEDEDGNSQEEDHQVRDDTPSPSWTVETVGTLGEVMAEQIPHLDVHLQVQLLTTHSLLPEGSSSRLRDTNLFKLLTGPTDSVDSEQLELDGNRPSVDDGCPVEDLRIMSITETEEEGIDEIEENSRHTNLDDMTHLVEEDTQGQVGHPVYQSFGAPTASPRLSDNDDSDSSISWDTPPTASSNLTHLPLTLHPSPIAILRRLPSFSALSLTSLNLAYSTIPDLERLASVLPVSLRELGLCGVRVNRAGSGLGLGLGRNATNGRALGGGGVSNRQRDGEVWRRGLSALGRRLIVLRMLDLSEAPFPLIQHHLTALLFPTPSRLPSLRLLSLRDSQGDIVASTTPTPETSSTSAFPDTVSSGKENANGLGRKGGSKIRPDLLELIRTRSRDRYLQVIW